MSEKEDDFAFFLGEKVQVGTTTGIINGQATFAYGPDRFEVVTLGDDCLPRLNWFEGQLIMKTKKD